MCNIATRMAAGFAPASVVVLSHDHRAVTSPLSAPRTWLTSAIPRCRILLRAHGEARALGCVTRLRSRHASKHHRARAEQVQGCLHLSERCIFPAQHKYLESGSFSSVNSAYFGVRLVRENIFQIWREEFFPVYKVLN